MYRMFIVCLFHFWSIACYKLFWNAFREPYSAVLCTVAIPSNKKLFVAVFAAAFLNRSTANSLLVKSCSFLCCS